MMDIARLGIRRFISIGGAQKKLPMHLAVGTSRLHNPSAQELKDVKAEPSSSEEVARLHVQRMDELFNYQLDNDIRVLTINLVDLPTELLPELRDYFLRLCEDGRIHKNQVRVFVVGQWYDIDYELSEAFKACMERTKSYDSQFLNFCIKYDGKEEVTSALKLLTRKILSGKLSEEDVTSQVVKDNISTSYFPPPEFIIETGRSYSGTLLWDSPGAVFYFSEKKWPDFDRKELEKAITFFDSETSGGS